MARSQSPFFSDFSEEEGAVNMPAFSLPFSVYMSQEAKQAFIDKHTRTWNIDASSIETLRDTVDQNFFGPLLEQARSRYAVHTERTSIGGVPVDIVTPQNAAKENDHCVLICLHGGSYELGNGGMCGLLEATPIASVSQIKVISIDYRQSPEHQYPAATEDVARVYSELLKTYKPENIGIYGSSAGAILTACSTAWFIKEKLPVPGAIGLFCAGADPRYAGDSRFITSPQCGDTPMPAVGINPPALLPGYDVYLQNANLNDPLVCPALSPETLQKFPPTIIISGTRAYDLSSAAYTHTQLVKLGVEANIYLWDGMWHGFYCDVDLPESREAFDITARFFQKKLLGESKK